KKAVTLMEVLVALIILAVVMAGIVNLFISGKRWILHMRARMAGGELGRQFLDPLQMDVRQDQWMLGANSNCLTSAGTASGTCGFFQPWFDPSGQMLYTPNYVITPLNVDATHPLGHLRRVVLTVTWNERDPNL
ncbi:MAG: prepilin-type N-terminal cleavage/methylation domain-containing protein, partial [Candidatus Omnitrophica bacterium]|nr:prepilin-type N-terminal cleavage/methylation domain-containing protein [Candidatus Omnitrophota bacterium]